jgi:hypothetical protein
LLIVFSCSKQEDEFEQIQSSNYNTSVINFKTNGGFEEYEPNNTMQTSNWQNIQITPDCNLLGFINYSNDEDWFRFYLENKKSIHFQLYGGALGGYTSAYLYNSSGSFLGTVNTDGTYTLRSFAVPNYILSVDYENDLIFKPSYTGYYYVKFMGYVANDRNYCFNVYLMDVNETEPNNSIATANGNCPPGAFIYGTADGTANYDYFRFDVPFTGKYSFNLEASGQYIQAVILNSSNQQIGSLGQNQSVTFNSLAGGTYYVRIEGYSSITYTFYSFHGV